MTDSTQVNERLDRLATAVGDVLTSARDKPQAVQLIANVLDDLHTVLENIALQAAPEQSPPSPANRRAPRLPASARPPRRRH